MSLVPARRLVTTTFLAFAPALPAQSPPPVYAATVCYQLKPGTTAEMRRNESAWARALEKAPHATNLIGMRSMTGPGAVCWLSYHPSMQAFALFREGATGIDATFEPAMRRYVESTTSAIAVQQHEISFGESNTLQKTMLNWAQYRMKPGTDALFIAAVQALAGARARAGLTNDWRVYRVVNGAPEGTWWVLSGQRDFTAIDKAFADDPKFAAAVTADDAKAFSAYLQNLDSSRSDLWVFDPAISAIAPAERAQHRFWTLPPVVPARK